MAANGNNRSGFFVRHRWLLWAVGIVGAVVLLASFMSHDDAVPIRSATVQPGTIRSIVSTNGKVEPLQSFEAHAPVGTTVKKLLVREGDHVNQGRSEEHTSELQSPCNLVCRLLLEKKK